MIDNNRKGSLFRRKVKDLMEAAGYRVTVRGLGFAGDDLSVDARWVKLSVEAKNHRKMALAAFVDQAVANAADDEIAVVIAHRMGKASAEDGYAVLRAGDLMRLLERGGGNG